jgi:hypothetical protein
MASEPRYGSVCVAYVGSARVSAHAGEAAIDRLGRDRA